MVRIAHISDTNLGKRPKRVRRGIIHRSNKTTRRRFLSRLDGIREPGYS